MRLHVWYVYILFLIKSVKQINHWCQLNFCQIANRNRIHSSYPEVPITKALTQNTMILYWAVLTPQNKVTVLPLTCVVYSWSKHWQCTLKQKYWRIYKYLHFLVMRSMERWIPANDWYLGPISTTERSTHLDEKTGEYISTLLLKISQERVMLWYDFLHHLHWKCPDRV